MSEDQIRQLYDLMHATKDVWKSGNENDANGESE